MPPMSGATLSMLPSVPSYQRSDATGESDAISLNSQGVEVHHLNDDNQPHEGEWKRRPQPQPQPQVQGSKGGGKRRTTRPNQKEKEEKAPVDPCKYKTKLCRSWMRDGTCSYEGVCCYAHGEADFRTVHQNTQVLSSLGYFSELMLLSVDGEKKPAPAVGAGGKGKGQKGGKRTPKDQGKPAQSNRGQLEPPSIAPQPAQINQPMVHLPYSQPPQPAHTKPSAPDMVAPAGVYPPTNSQYAWQYPAFPADPSRMYPASQPPYPMHPDLSQFPDYTQVTIPPKAPYPEVYGAYQPQYTEGDPPWKAAPVMHTPYPTPDGGFYQGGALQQSGGMPSAPQGRKQTAGCGKGDGNRQNRRNKSRDN